MTITVVFREDMPTGSRTHHLRSMERRLKSTPMNTMGVSATSMLLSSRTIMLMPAN